MTYIDKDAYVLEKLDVLLSIDVSGNLNKIKCITLPDTDNLIGVCDLNDGSIARHYSLGHSQRLMRPPNISP